MPFPFVRRSEGVWEANPQGRGDICALEWAGWAREDRSAQGTQSALSPQAGSVCRWREARPPRGVLKGTAPINVISRAIGNLGVSY